MVLAALVLQFIPLEMGVGDFTNGSVSSLGEAAPFGIVVAFLQGILRQVGGCAAAMAVFSRCTEEKCLFLCLSILPLPRDVKCEMPIYKYQTLKYTRKQNVVFLVYNQGEWQ